MHDLIAQALTTAIQLQQAGRLPEAESICRDILVNHPRHADALHLLGLIALQGGAPEYAATLIEQAVDINKKVPLYHFNLANAMKTLGQAERAARHYASALRLKPDFADAHLCLGNLLVQRGDMAEGIRHLKSAASLSGSALAHYNLGSAYLKEDQAEAAVTHFRKAVELDDGFAQAHLNLGGALSRLGDSENALRQFEKVLSLNPASAEARIGMGNAHYMDNDIASAMAHFHQAIALQPDSAIAHTNLAHGLLKLGQLEQGWREYEWRLKLSRAPLGNMPRWDGSPLNGKRLLVMAEQGAGDTIQFVRYLPLLRERAGENFAFACHRSLLKLMAPVAGSAELLELEKLNGDAAADCQVNLMSLPYLFGTTLDSIPSPGAYLQVDGKRVEHWRQRLSAHPGLKIGIAWAGNPANGNDKFRSFAPERYAKLAKLPGITLISLQKAAARKSAKNLIDNSVADYTQELSDFADTAALMENLDLVISIDTSIAHLAGAMGKPVWALLHLGTDWRYLREGDKCPWYASMRLFRQASRGDWDSVFDALLPALREFIESRTR